MYFFKNKHRFNSIFLHILLLHKKKKKKKKKKKVPSPL